jgi:hypothetical protein
MPEYIVLNIKIDLRDQWWAVVYTVMNCLIPVEEGGNLKWFSDFWSVELI